MENVQIEGNKMPVQKESSGLYKGIFWVKDIENISENALCFQTLCDANGDTIVEDGKTYTSKNGLTFNHKNTWETLPRSKTDGKPFHYYPRGRVEIRNGVATIFCNPNIYCDELVRWAKDKFNLNEQNGIKSVRILADHSEHYRCHLDGHS